MATPTPIKTYHERNQDSFTGRRTELLQDGQTILWVKKEQAFLSKKEIHIRSESDKGPILAAAQLINFGVRVLIGGEKGPVDPAATPKGEWWNVLSNGVFSGKEYEFRLGAGRYVWRRTHNKALGASSLGGMDFKLVDMSNARDGDKGSERVLAVYIHDRSAFNRRDIGRIDFMVELGQDLELFALAAILGIQEKIRQKKTQQRCRGWWGRLSC